MLPQRNAKRKKNATAGGLYIHQPNVATTYETSADGRRVAASSTFVDISIPGLPASYEQEDLQTAEALEQPEFSYLCGDSGDWDEPHLAQGWNEGGTAVEGDGDGITMRIGVGATAEAGEDEERGNFERWHDADKPMKVFVERHREETLDEMLRAEGRGSPDAYEFCCGCNQPSPLFRCARQTCLGAGMYCEACIVRNHRYLPTHGIERWTGELFESMTVAGLSIEARVQLGHAQGQFCAAARPAHKDFVIIDTLGVRVAKVNFCGCQPGLTHRQQLMRACLWPATSKDPQTCATLNSIRLFELQNCLGKISAYDYVRSLELLSNNDGLNPPPDRRRAFRNIVRQYRMMEMLKRGGRGHDDKGIAGTKQGELALPCRACPHPGINLPEGWDSINWDEMDEDQRYKYFLFLAEDANFKLINRNVGTEENDPVVDDGAGYFCNRREYVEHIRNNVDEEEISSCSGFQSLFLANVKRVKGLRTTGVGGVTCARHNMWRANGVGDLQAGERYCNMDFLFFSAVANFSLMWLVLSYDIACQFSKNIWSRMEKLPAKFHLKINWAFIRWMVPNFHVLGHRIGCHVAFSFHWLWGAGRTHGETVEQNWGFLNGIAGATKMMGLGARYTALEGLLAFHNWRRGVSHRRILKQRMAEGMKDGRVHKESFQAFHDGLVGQPGVNVQEWRAWCDRWERSAHVEGEKGSPYDYEEEVQTLKEIRLKLAAEEYAQTGAGDEIEREDTPSTFLTMGLEIEEAQRQLAVTIRATGPHPTTSQELEFLKRRTGLRVRLQGFRKLQGTYMPNVRRYLTGTQKLVWDADDKLPEATRLFMPSDIATTKDRRNACATGLDGVKARLRQAEADDALRELRQGLRTRTMTNRFKIRNWTGQRALTRGQGILRHINIKIHAAKLRYRYARQALLKLRGHGVWEQTLRVLEEEDVRALNERALREEEQAVDEHLGALGVAAAGGVAATRGLAAGEGYRTLSWIWYGASTSEDGDEKLHEALRVEYCRGYSRANRWREDLVLVDEEMRRTMEYGAFEERRWRERAAARTVMLTDKTTPVDAATLEGVRSYALEQADRERRTALLLHRDWDAIRLRAAAYLRGEDMSQLPPVLVEVDPEQLRWAERRMHEAEEIENDMYQ